MTFEEFWANCPNPGVGGVEREENIARMAWDAAIRSADVSRDAVLEEVASFVEKMGHTTTVSYHGFPGDPIPDEQVPISPSDIAMTIRQMLSVNSPRQEGK